MIRITLALLVVLIGCRSRPWIGDVWPLTPAIAAKSTHTITGARPGMSDVEGRAFQVSPHHLITAAANCMGDSAALTLDVRGVRHPIVLVQLEGGLCLVRSPHLLGNALIVARSMPLRDRPLATVEARGTRLSRHEVSIPWNTLRAGTPVFDGCGVVGVIAGPRVGGEPGSRVVTVGELQRFLGASGVDWELEPLPPGGIDMGGNAWPSKESDLGAGEPNHGRGGCR